MRDERVQATMISYSPETPIRVRNPGRLAVTPRGAVGNNVCWTGHVEVKQVIVASNHGLPFSNPSWSTRHPQPLLSGIISPARVVLNGKGALISSKRHRHRVAGSLNVYIARR